MGGGGGSRSSSSYHEEVIRRPDDVKIAQINAEKEVRVLELEGQNLEARTRAQIELTETNARLMLLMEEARISNLQKTSEALLGFTQSINTFAQERIACLNTDDFEQTEKINRHYNKVILEIHDNEEHFMTQTFPKYVETANKKEKDSTAFNIYYKTIDSVSANFTKGTMERITHAIEQQRMLISGNQELKKMIIGSTQKIVELTMTNAGLMLENSPIFKELNQQIKNKTQLNGSSAQKQLQDGETNE